MPFRADRIEIISPLMAVMAIGGLIAWIAALLGHGGTEAKWAGAVVFMICTAAALVIRRATARMAEDPRFEIVAMTIQPTARRILVSLKKARIEAAMKDVGSESARVPASHGYWITVDAENEHEALQIVAEIDADAVPSDKAHRIGAEPPPDVTVTCDACGRTMNFAAWQSGSIQACQSCGEYVDVPAR